MSFAKLLRLLPIALIIAAMAFAVACGDDDDTNPSPRATTSIAAGDETAIDKAITDVLAALEQNTGTALDPLSNEELRGRPEQLDRLGDCFPEGATISVRNRELEPGNEGEVRVTINFTVTQDGATENARRDWRFERQSDGSFLLSEAPTCPFKRAVPSADVETAVPETETPTDEETPAE